MGMFKRIGMFLLVNGIVILSISTILNSLHLMPYLNKNGLDYYMLAAFCLVWGMTGSIISLLLSRWIAKRAYGVQILDLNTMIPWERMVLEQVYEASKKAGIKRMPQVGIYQANEINAFATGPTKNRALVALSSGLVQTANAEQIHGVVGHEIAHIANGDMVTMTLLQGLVNSFVLFLSRAIAHLIVVLIKRDNTTFGYIIFAVITFVLEMILMVLGSLVVAHFSRMREYRADKYGSELVGKYKVMEALKMIQLNAQVKDPYIQKTAMAFKNLQISHTESKWASLFASHPSLDRRLDKVRKL